MKYILIQYISLCCEDKVNRVLKSYIIGEYDNQTDAYNEMNICIKRPPKNTSVFSANYYYEVKQVYKGNNV